ncbi:MAG TPA: PACE efflux transporter [Aquabacterium sp.]|uniref:PACE efflux transporter n=1 Tax=Aquabacterium sp. TaxID=1872578 RepID=UPI002E2FBCEA|nr:PACE efflux transporter [Aquabacterium sp.]HEX5373196.1 PACE efflux transporter [Aquabacterium sp.]
MQGVKRRIVHTLLYEALAIAFVTVAVKLLGWSDTGGAMGLAVLSSVLAMAWNLVFNLLFEAWERRQTRHGRSALRRAAHALGFEGGLVLLTVPLFMWWLDLGWWAALVADLSLVLFFLVYTYVFNWVFDHIFGLPAASRAPG